MNRPLIALAVCLSLAAAARADDDREIVRVNGTPIRQSEVIQRLWRRYGNETLENMIDELLLRQEAQRRKITAAPAEVDRRFARMGSQFSDPKLLEAQLEQYGSSIDGLKQEIGEELSREKIVLAYKHLAVTDAEVRAAFSEHKDELGRPAAVHLRHILVAAEPEAQQLVSQIKSGADFSALAREKSLAATGKLNGGDYGFVSKGMLPPDIEDVAFALEPGEIRVIPSQRGSHILQALERRQAAPAQFAQVKDDLRATLLEAKLKQALPDVVKELRQKADIQPAGARPTP